VIKNNPAFARQRENMTEFKCCSFWASLLVSVLFDLEHLFSGYYFSGFMSLDKKIQKHDDVSKKGISCIEVEQGGVLADFFSPQQDVSAR
jgi:hypothetical protein